MKKKSPIANLPEGVSVGKSSTKSKKHPERAHKVYWRVRLGKKFTGGKARKENFPINDLDAARKWIFGEGQKFGALPTGVVALKTSAGTSAFAITSAQLTEAGDAFRRCSEVGMTLTAAVDFAIKHNSPTGGKKSVTDAIEELIGEKRADGLRPIYTTKLKEKLLRFAKWLPAKTNINEVTFEKVKAFFKHVKLGPGGKAVQLRHMNVLFKWAVLNGYAAANPCTKIVKPKVTLPPPSILRPNEALSLLNVAEAFTPYVAVGLFAGLRPHEAQRTCWEHIDFGNKHFDLPASITKEKKRRIIPFLGKIEAWLLPYRKDSGPIVPLNFRRRFWAVTERAGFRPSEENKKAPGWPPDLLRHSFGSYFVAWEEDAGKTGLYMGHRDANMLFDHYRAVIKNLADVEAYWNLHPGQTRV
jgi:integrase